MPFIAEDKATGSRINIVEYKDPKRDLVKGEVICPFCKEEMLIKDGLIRRAYFAHKGDCPLDEFKRHPESLEHLFFKSYIAENVGKEFISYTGAKAHFEYVIHEAKRIADIVFEFPNGWLVAHEIQLSSITTEELGQRTEDYRNAGVDVIWWLRKSANTPTNREWVLKQCGECYTLDYQEAVRVLRKESALRDGEYDSEEFSVERECL